MSPTSPAGEEVVEKRASAPVSTACLVIACAALLGGIIFQVLEIAEYRSGPGDPKDLASKRYKADIRKLNDQVEEILSKATVGSAGLEPPGDTPAPADPGDSTEGEETPPDDAGSVDEVPEEGDGAG